MIEFKGVYKEYSNGVMAMNNTNTKIEQGEFVYLIGPSGAGKSTFLKLIYRDILPSVGDVFVDNKSTKKYRKRNVYKLRRKQGVVFQDFKLLYKNTIFENISFVLETFGMNRLNIRKKVFEMLDLVNLKDKYRYYPNQLSGGEQQRVAIARALINKPKVLICDEPTGNLDPKTSEEIMYLLEKVNAGGTTVIMATHDKEIVNKFRHRVIAIEYGNVIKDEEMGEYHYDHN